MEKAIKVYLAGDFDQSLLIQLNQNGFDCVDGLPVHSLPIFDKITECTVIIISAKSRITPEIIDSLPHLKLIARAGSGLDNVDVRYAESKGIYCINTPEGNRDSVAEHALGMILALLHNFASQNDVINGYWQPYSNRPFELRGKTVAIIGYGNTGSTLAQLLEVFGCRIIAYDKYKSNFGTKHLEETTWNHIYENADVLSLHIPLTLETQHIINTDVLKRFKKKIIIINTSRGEVVDTAALLAALHNGHIAGAGLDVVENENDYSQSDLYKFYQHYFKQKRVLKSAGYLPLIVTPHIAGKSIESQVRIAQYLIDKILAWRNNILSN